MPIPKPRKGETEKDFISRCMGDEVMREFKPPQRRAVCQKQWEEKANFRRLFEDIVNEAMKEG